MKKSLNLNVNNYDRWLTLWIGLSTLIVAIPNVTIAAENQLGKTILARGSVSANRDNVKRKLKRLSPIYRQDVLRSGLNARAQFRMIDNAMINLQENSVLQLHKYELRSSGGDGSVFMELLSGGLRTITGAIGKKNKADYQLRTPVATIGIRGTMYEAEIVSDGMYVGAWRGAVSVRSHSGKCNLNLGDGYKDRFVFIDQQGICKKLDQIPKVFKRGHSSSVKVVVEQNSFKIDPLLENPKRELPFRGLTVGQGDAGVRGGRADSISRSNPTIDVSDINNNSIVNAQVNSTADFTQNVGGFAVSWGSWNDYSVSPELDGIPSDDNDDSDGLIWSTYEPADAAIVSGRTGEVRYDNMVDNLVRSSMGPVTNVAVQMDVNFDDASVTNGAISANVPGFTWVGAFDGQVTQGELVLELDGAALVNAQSGVLTTATGEIAGDFVGANAEGITGGFSLTDEINNDNKIEGVFLVEQGQ